MARQYFQAYVPEKPEGEISTQRSTWGGINKKIAVDSGEFSSGKMFVPYGQYIESAPIKSTFLTKAYGYVLGAYGVSNFMLVVYKEASNGANIYVDYITSTGTVYTSTLKGSATTDTDKRYITQFNVYSNPLEPLTGTYTRSLLIYPDRVSIDYVISANSFAFTSFASTTPAIKYPVVHLSRLFGVDGERVYASEFNDYSAWDLDTGDEYLESNAWATTSQSNTKADGLFTAIASYDGHVYCFKDDFMHQINNTKNPFRLIDIGQHGCVNNESLVECSGYFFFVSKDGVNFFSGGYPKVISDNLGITDYSGSKLAAYDDILYFYNGGTIYTYDVKMRVWGVRDASYTIAAFITNTAGIFAVTSTGIYNLNSSSYPAALGDCEFVTDLISLGITDVKRLKRLSVMANFGADAQLATYAVTSTGDVLLGGYATTKTEIPYNPVTWVEWTNRTLVSVDSSGATFTGDGTDYPCFRISTSLKTSTKYGLLLNVVTNELTAPAVLKVSANLTGSQKTIAAAGVTGNCATTFTTSSSIANNFFQLEMGIVPTGKIVKISDIRLYELPTGSQIESDFTNLTADQLYLVYPLTATKSVRIITRKFAGDYQQLKFKIKGYVRIYNLILTYSKAGGRYDNR